ncbi:hypothetical protein RB601_006509 [Gaeumannomyces tritici]
MPLLSTKGLFALLAACAVGGTSAHMIMRKPVPYNHHDTMPLTQVNPLDVAAHPFPGQGLNKVVEMANYTAGTPAEVSFTGTAVHGGGSCQFAIAYHDDSVDPATLRDPKAWRVLASVIGGCPAEAVGNLDETGRDSDGRFEGKVCAHFAEKECSKTFKIPLPKELPNGRASFAWTWFNNIGNREMYMNVAPVIVSGGSDRTAGFNYLETLPPLFIANIAGDPLSTCATGKEGVLGFPNPGKTGMVIQDADAESSGTCEMPKALKPEFENDITQLNHAGGGPGAGNSSSSQPPYTGPISSAPGGGFSTIPSVPTTLITSTTRPAVGADQGMTTTVTTTVHATVYVTLPGAATSYVTGGGSAASGMPAPPVSVACKEGDVMICIGSTHFGLCNHGSAIPQPVAAGTVCSRNQIVHQGA